jgi:hypothetical protein
VDFTANLPSQSLMATGFPNWTGRSFNKKPATSAVMACCSDMPNRDRLFQERLAKLEQQWLSGSSDARLSIERAMLRILIMEEVILRAQERADIAELRLAHAEEIVRKLDRRS